MKRLFTLLLSLFILTACVHSQWVWQNPLPQGNGVYDIKMFPGGTGYSHAYYQILKTTDYGMSWDAIHYDDRINTIFFLNEQIGYYSQSDFATLSSKLYRTSNGGNNWSLINAFVNTHFAPMYWLDQTTGYAFKDYNKLRIIKTTNGGITWNNIFFDTNITINSFSFPSSSTGYLAGKISAFPGGSKLFKTTNAGISWDSLPTRFREFTSLCFLDENIGYLSGNSFSSISTKLLRTTNGGASWDSLNNSNAVFSKMQFLDLQNGFAYNTGVSKTTNSGVNWILLNTYPETNMNINSFSALSINDIYISGDKGSVGRSTNGGTNWTNNKKGFSGFLYDIKFFDANTGIATGGFSGSICLRTTNSGLTWDTNTIGPNYFECIYKFDDNIAYIASQGRIYKTTNRGLNFVSYPTATNSAWTDVSFPTPNTGYTISKYSTLDKTTNGGQSWINISSQGPGEFYTICFIDNNTGFYGGSKIMKTTNGGTSWDTLQTGLPPVRHFSNRLRYINNVLYSAGSIYFNGRNKAVLYKSTNLGAEWNLDSSMNDNDLSDISIPAPGIIFLMGTRYVHKSVNGSAWGLHNPYIESSYYNTICFINIDTGFIATYQGGILKTTNGGGTPIGINIGSNEIPKNFNLYQNYPNPFNPTTIIEYSLPKSSLVTIKVYDILGRFVTELVNLEQAAGHHSIPFDGSHYASGIYFYTIETPGFIQSKKMVLLK